MEAAGVSGAEGPPHHDGPDDITVAKQRTSMEVKHPGTAASRDLEHETHSGVTILCTDRPDEDPSQEDLSAANTAGASGGQRQSPVLSVISMKSDESMDRFIEFTGDRNMISFHHDRHSPVSSVISLKSDQSMDRFIEFTGDRNMISALPMALGAVLCDVCSKKAFKSCLTCMASFCGDHVKPHYTAPALQRHRLVDATEDLEQRLCQRHNRELELYCNTDQTNICALCVVKEHRGHDVTDLEEHQGLRNAVSNTTTAVPPPGPIEFTSVKPDSVCVCWGPPEGLTGPHTFRVTWTAEGKQEKLQVQGQKLHVQELNPGEKYTFTVATLMEDGRESSCVAATMHTDVPPPEDVAVKVDLPSALVSWSKPAGVDQASYKLTLNTDGKCTDTFSVKSLQHSITELHIGGKYTISVSTVLNGRLSQLVSRPIRTNIFEPQGLSVVALEVNHLFLWDATLRWSLPGADQTFDRFVISYNGIPQPIETNTQQVVLKNLQPDTEYTVEVSAVFKSGKRKSSSVTFQTRERTILLLGQRGDGKSSTGNTILGEDVFKVRTSQYSVTSDCKAKSRIINGMKYTVIDTHGFSDTNKAEKDLKRDFVKCITECSQGIHAVVIVMKVMRYTEQESKYLELLKEKFSEDIYRHTMVVFTHGNELGEGQTIEQFVEENLGGQGSMKTFVYKCHGGYHVIDNENWKSQEEGECSNKSRLAKLFSTVEEMVQKNGSYTNETYLVMWETIEQGIQSLANFVSRLVGTNIDSEHNNCRIL